jgi:hypothetical protein
LSAGFRKLLIRVAVDYATIGQSMSA